MAGFLFMQEAVRCEADAANEKLDVHLATTLLIIGADAGRLLRNEQRNITQNYPCLDCLGSGPGPCGPGSGLDRPHRSECPGQHKGGPDPNL